METILFTDMLKLLRSGQVVDLQYVTFSERRQRGGELRQMRCRRKPSQAQGGHADSGPAPKRGHANREIIHLNVELIAGDAPTGELRRIYPLFITHINDKEVRIA